MVCGRGLSVLQRFQRLGGALFTPVLLFSFAGLIVGLGTLFTTPQVMGPIAVEDTLWVKVWRVLLAGGWTAFNQLPLLFSLALPMGLAKTQRGRCCLESLAAYLTFDYLVGAIVTVFLGSDVPAGMVSIAGVRTLDTGIIGALAVSGVTVALHNRFFDVRLPQWLGVFSGTAFVYLLSFAAAVGMSIVTVLAWPFWREFLEALRSCILSSGSWGVAAFVAIDRALTPLGLHHLFYAPVYYDNVVVDSGIYVTWAHQLPQLASSGRSLAQSAPWAALSATGWSKVFGAPGIALAFYATCPQNRRRKLAAFLVPATLSSMLCGITEPLEFAFLFAAPQLFALHVALSALLAFIVNHMGVVGVFSGGLIEMASFNFIPLAASHGMEYLRAAGVGLAFTAIYFVSFRLLITRFDLKTPGRGDGLDFSRLPDWYHSVRSEGGRDASDWHSAARTHAGETHVSPLAQGILGGLGGAGNVVGITPCMTRLRVTVANPAAVADDASFASLGVLGVFRAGSSVQVVVGTRAPELAEEISSALGGDARDL